MSLMNWMSSQSLLLIQRVQEQREHLRAALKQPEETVMTESKALPATTNEMIEEDDTLGPQDVVTAVAVVECTDEDAQPECLRDHRDHRDHRDRQARPLKKGRQVIEPPLNFGETLANQLVNKYVGRTVSLKKHHKVRKSFVVGVTVNPQYDTHFANDISWWRVEIDTTDGDNPLPAITAIPLTFKKENDQFWWEETNQVFDGSLWPSLGGYRLATRLAEDDQPPMLPSHLANSNKPLTVEIKRGAHTHSILFINGEPVVALQRKDIQDGKLDFQSGCSRGTLNPNKPLITGFGNGPVWVYGSELVLPEEDQFDLTTYVGTVGATAVKATLDAIGNPCVEVLTHVVQFSELDDFAKSLFENPSEPFRVAFEEWLNAGGPCSFRRYEKPGAETTHLIRDDSFIPVETIRVSARLGDDLVVLSTETDEVICMGVVPYSPITERLHCAKQKMETWPSDEQLSQSELNVQADIWSDKPAGVRAKVDAPLTLIMGEPMEERKSFEEWVSILSSASESLLLQRVKLFLFETAVGVKLAADWIEVPAGFKPGRASGLPKMRLKLEASTSWFPDPTVWLIANRQINKVVGTVLPDYAVGLIRPN